MSKKKKQPKQPPGMLAPAPSLPQNSTAQLPWDRLSRTLEEAEFLRVFHEARMNNMFAQALDPAAPPRSCAGVGRTL
jgi:hypothetical protein